MATAGDGSDTVGRRDADAEVRCVLAYLRHAEAGRLDEAGTYLSADVRHTFPGGRQFADLGEWFAYFRSRIRRVRKRDHQIDVCRTGNGDLVVYVRGFLEGETVLGDSFDDVRFIDRFVVSDGKIVDQQVWNDLVDDSGPARLPARRPEAVAARGVEPRRRDNSVRIPVGGSAGR